MSRSLKLIRSGDIEEGFAELHVSAESGNLWSLLFLGEFELSRSTSEEYLAKQRAVRYFARASLSGCKQSDYWLKRIETSPDDATLHEDAALSWADKVSPLDSYNHWISIADFADDGRTEVSFAAIIAYREAAKGGSMSAQRWYGWHLVEGAEKYRQGLYFLESAASSGCRTSRYLIALLYLRGQGVERDPSKALGMLRTNLANGHALSGFLLYKMYELGDDVRICEHEAIESLLIAARGGIDEAKFVVTRLQIDNLD